MVNYWSGGLVERRSENRIWRRGMWLINWTVMMNLIPYFLFFTGSSLASVLWIYTPILINPQNRKMCDYPRLVGKQSEVQPLLWSDLPTSWCSVSAYKLSGPLLCSWPILWQTGRLLFDRKIIPIHFWVYSCNMRWNSLWCKCQYLNGYWVFFEAVF